jgi:hypothetical protein
MWRTSGVALLGLAALATTAVVARADEAKAEAPSAFTLGAVQKELRPGLSQAEVVERLGSPNILTRDRDGREAWVYDRVMTEVETSKSGASVGGGGTGASGSVAGLIGIRAGKSRETLRSSQRTLTVVVRFGSAGTVESVSWHASRF